MKNLMIISNRTQKRYKKGYIIKSEFYSGAALEMFSLLPYRFRNGYFFSGELYGPWTSSFFFFNEVKSHFLKLEGFSFLFLQGSQQPTQSMICACLLFSNTCLKSIKLFSIKNASNSILLRFDDHNDSTSGYLSNTLGFCWKKGNFF